MKLSTNGINEFTQLLRNSYNMKFEEKNQTQTFNRIHAIKLQAKVLQAT